MFLLRSPLFKGRFFLASCKVCDLHGGRWLNPRAGTMAECSRDGTHRPYLEDCDPIFEANGTERSYFRMFRLIWCFFIP